MSRSHIAPGACARPRLCGGIFIPFRFGPSSCKTQLDHTRSSLLPKTNASSLQQLSGLGKPAFQRSVPQAQASAMSSVSSARPAFLASLKATYTKGEEKIGATCNAPTLLCRRANLVRPMSRKLCVHQLYKILSAFYPF